MLLRHLLTRQTLTRSWTRTFSTTLPSRQQILNADESTFKLHVTNTQNKIILVDFFEDWCPPCKVLSPLLEKIEANPSLIGANRSLDLITLQGEKVPALAAQYKIRAVPTVFAFKNGSVIGQFTGALSLPQIKQWYETLPR